MRNVFAFSTVALLTTCLNASAYNVRNFIIQDVKSVRQSAEIELAFVLISMVTVSLDSPWLDGGHNQSEVCGGLAGQVKAKYPGKDVKIKSMSENNHKDLLGHVTYQYHCQFEVAE